MACKEIDPTIWDWKSGKFSSLTIGSLKTPLNYFSCGTYFFDGFFHVVSFPKGMTLFHGSGGLANANAEFPIGSDFYDEKIDGKRVNLQELIDNDEITIQEVLSKDERLNTGWFSDAKVAELYSKKDPKGVCNDTCIHAYTMKKDAMFIILDNDFNIWRLLNYPDIPSEVYTALKVMFDIKSKNNVTNSKTTYGDLVIPAKKRKSYYQYDIPFTTWLCTKTSGKYAGYAANVQIEAGIAYFHQEIVFCRATSYLERDLFNPKDWQYINLDGVDSLMKDFLTQLSYYKSINVGFHAGDLFEHSIWSLLFAEDLLMEQVVQPPLMREDIKRIAAVAFIHDIGKMDPANCTKRKHDMIYFSLPDHPNIGAEYILGTRPLVKLDKDMNVVGNFDVPRLLTLLGFKPDEFTGVAMVIKHHWQFGESLQKYKGIGDKKTAQEYLSIVGEGLSLPFLYYYTLVVVSAADVLASQPYGKGDLTKDLNRKSIFFPFISNVPKKYKGGRVAEKSAIKRREFAKEILGNFSEFTAPNQRFPAT